VRNVHRLVKELDGVRIGGIILHVNIPRFMRVEHLGGGTKVGVSRNRDPQPKGIGKKQVWKQKEQSKSYL